MRHAVSGLVVLGAVGALILFGRTGTEPSPVNPRQESGRLDNGFASPGTSSWKSFEQILGNEEAMLANVKEVVVSLPTPAADNRNDTNQENKEEWNRIGRNNRSIARLFALVPCGVTEAMLLRNETLNPADRIVSQSERYVLKQILQTFQVQITDCLRSRSKLQGERLKSLANLGQLTEIRQETVPPEILAEAKQRAGMQAGVLVSKVSTAEHPTSIERLEQSLLLDALEQKAREIVPGAKAFLRTEGRLLIATGDQLPEIGIYDEYKVYLSTMFLQEVLGWFLVRGFMMPAQADDEIAIFLKLVKKPKQRM